MNRGKVSIWRKVPVWWSDRRPAAPHPFIPVETLELEDEFWEASWQVRALSFALGSIERNQFELFSIGNKPIQTIWQVSCISLSGHTHIMKMVIPPPHTVYPWNSTDYSMAPFHTFQIGQEFQHMTSHWFISSWSEESLTLTGRFINYEIAIYP